MNEAQRAEELASLRIKYKGYCDKGLKLDMSRGKPSPEQLVLTQDMLKVLTTPQDCITETGLDCRNYGHLDGIPEAKRIFADILGVNPESIIVTGNSSLNIMYDEISRAMLYGTCDSPKPWSKLERVRFLCPCPGYDRHFAICEALGIEMINIPMTPTGPDMDMVERLVASDASIKGIWCVPKYSNPEGTVYSDETVRRFAALKPLAPDFRIFWDNAYVIHALYGEPAEQLNLLTEAKKYGNENLPLIFTSTSKITFPGSGISVLAASDANLAHTRKYMSIQTIGYDKLNMMRHVLYFGSAEGVKQHMKEHADILYPKFKIVLDALETLRPYGIADWSNPQGGYFISLNVPDNCAKRVFDLCGEAGVKLTNAGATFPYGHDPRNRNLRIAPSYPSSEDLAAACEILCVCVRISALEAMAD